MTCPASNDDWGLLIDISTGKVKPTPEDTAVPVPAPELDYAAMRAAMQAKLREKHGLGGTPPPAPVGPFAYRARPERLIKNPAQEFDWLIENLGGPMLPGFFRRGNGLVRVPRIGEHGYKPPKEDGWDDGPAQVRRANAETLRTHIQTNFLVQKWFKELKDDAYIAPVLYPREPCVMAVEGVIENPAVPVIRAITHTPTFRSDGTLVQTPGYDESGVLFLPLVDTTFPVIEEHVEAQHVQRAVEQINYLLQDFPFVDDTSRANMLALLVTPTLRLLLPPPYPFFAIGAPQPGSGKTLLAKLACLLHGGVHRPALPPDDEEIRKQMVTILRATTAPVIVWDNLTGVVKSGQFANLLTTPKLSDRLLGTNDDVEVINDRVWVGTGNNVRIGGDMGRRTYRIDIDPQTPDPQNRTGFRERDLLGYVSANRGELLAATLTLVRAWVQEGRPRLDHRSDDYDKWSGGVAEI
ncbi:MAG: hypothetical protein H0T54_07470, partial [Geodermatophilaceae bacterium]|nr:hypothetical protein [Geodermatophilaceae bacterium]